MEIWDIYDQNRMKTGATIERGSKLGDNEYHLVVHVCLFNPAGKMLIQQRQSFKDGWPNWWDVSAGGSALAGETSQEAAAREILEEIGYKTNLSNQRPSFTVSFQTGFNDFYLIEDDVDITQLVLQKEEVQAIKWASKEEILQMMDAQEFVPYHRGLIDIMFSMLHCDGALRA
jgi:isopentenyldiphosphate isomerase